MFLVVGVVGQIKLKMMIVHWAFRAVRFLRGASFCCGHQTPYDKGIASMSDDELNLALCMVSLHLTSPWPGWHSREWHANTVDDYERRSVSTLVYKE